MLKTEEKDYIPQMRGKYVINRFGEEFIFRCAGKAFSTSWSRDSFRRKVFLSKISRLSDTSASALSSETDLSLPTKPFNITVD